MDEAPQRVTMRDIARRLGVASSTVSRALRDDPSIPLERREKIKRLAEELHYRPDPLVSSLMAQIHHQRRRTDPDRLAWINLWPVTSDAPIVSMLGPLLKGAMERAAALGYGIEVHHAGSVPLNPARLQQILLTRSQWGFIIPPVPEHAKRFPLEMQELTGVTIGTSLLEPRLHRVTTHHFQTAQLGWQKLHAKGFKRIGLAVSARVNARLDGRWLGGFVAAQVAGHADPVVPPLLVDEGEYPRFESWFGIHRPDAVLLSETFIAHWIQALSQRLHLPPPAIAWLALDPAAKDAWGLDYRAELIGAAAVEMVAAQLQRNERGNVRDPHTLMLDSVWREG